jgi:hypothetical protein
MVISSTAPILKSMDVASRDQGLRKVSRATRWVMAGGIVLSGLLTAVVARLAPGHKASSATTRQPVSSTANESDDNSSSTNGGSIASGGLQPPAQPPSAARGGGSVRSGAS